MDPILIANAAVNGGVVGLLLALPALAVTMVFGIARFPNAATGDYMTFGAYTAVAMQSLLGLPLVASGLAGVLATSVLALLFYAGVFRLLEERPVVTRLIASIGIAFALRSTVTFFAGHSQYSLEAPLVRAWNFGGVRILPTDVYIGLVALGALALVFLLLHFTPAGRRMRAVADNPELAAASGISRRSVMMLLWVVAGAFSGLGGILLGVKAIVLPDLGWELLMPIFAAVILGGVGSTVGAVVGMIVFGVAMEVATLYVGTHYKIVLAFAVLLVVLLWRPQGIFGRPLAVR